MKIAAGSFLLTSIVGIEDVVDCTCRCVVLVRGARFGRALGGGATTGTGSG